MKSSVTEKIQQMRKGYEKHSMNAFFAFPMFLLIFLLGTSFADELSRSAKKERECLSISTDHISHGIAISRLMKIAEVQHWKDLLQKNNRHISIIPDTNHTIFRDSQCLWEVNLYEAVGGRYLRWHAYQISSDKEFRYRLDVVGSDK